MKKLMVSAAGLVIVASAPAWGQAKNFEGFGLGTQIDILQLSYDSNVSGPGFTASDSQSKSEVNVTLNGQYNYALGENWLIGAGLDVGISKKTVSMFGSLGYALSDTSMVFAKISSETLSINTVILPTGATSNRDFHGVGVGAGYRSNFTKKMYWQVALDTTKFDPIEDSLGSTQTKFNRFSIGLGTRF